MTRYRVFVPSTVTYITEVEADSPDEAIDVVEPGPGLCHYCAKSISRLRPRGGDSKCSTSPIPAAASQW